MNEAESKQHFADISTLRMAIVFAGLVGRVEPSPEITVKVFVTIGYETPIDKPIDGIPWNVFTLEEGNPCPVHRLMMPRWLVAGAMAALNIDDDGEAPFGDIAPDTWITNLPLVLGKLPKSLVTPGVARMAAVLLGAAYKAPREQLDLIRAALNAKAEAIKQGIPCPDGQEPATIGIAVIGL